MNSFELELHADSEKHGEKKKTVYEYVTGLILPALALVATIVALNNHSRIAIDLIALTFLCLVLALYPPLSAAWRRLTAQRAAESVAQQAFPELKKLVRRFEDFVDGRQSNTLHALVQNELCQGNGAIYNSLLLPDMGIWTGFRDFFAQRLEKEKPTLSALRRATFEFHHLVGTYNNQCVALVFERLPPELQNAMTAKAKSSFNSLQQRLLSLLTAYQDFAKNLAESCPALSDVPRYFALPKPF